MYLLGKDDDDQDITVEQQAQNCDYGERHPDGERGHHRSQALAAGNASRRLIALATSARQVSYQYLGHTKGVALKYNTAHSQKSGNHLTRLRFVMVFLCSYRHMSVYKAKVMSLIKRCSRPA
jgi:hypothetical protein